MKNLIVQYDTKLYMIIPDDLRTSRLKGAKVKVIESRDGEVKMYYRGRELEYRIYNEMPYEKPQARTSEADKWVNKTTIPSRHLPSLEGWANGNHDIIISGKKSSRDRFTPQLTRQNLFSFKESF